MCFVMATKGVELPNLLGCLEGLYAAQVLEAIKSPDTPITTHKTFIRWKRGSRNYALYGYIVRLL